jgi:riboflavin kinase/FMN adenylyltransferase
MMKIFRSIEEIKDIGNTAVALGNFEGVHYGHQALIRRMKEEADAEGLIPSVFTFSNHPRDLLPELPRAKRILFKSEKEQIMESLGVEYLFSLPFTEEIMKMPPEDYVKKLLSGTLHAKAVFCGFNHTFGYKASGNPEMLKSLCAEEGISTFVMDPFTIDGQVVSSTLIRKLIAEGRVDECEKYMGRRYAVYGEVVEGNHLGKTLGFPTSNLVIDETMVAPPNGVYVTDCIYAGKKYSSITNVGVKPTIGEFSKNIETHIFDFDKELYGKTIKVEFIEKLRDEKKFASRELLSEQIRRDCLTARDYHERHGALKK